MIYLPSRLLNDEERAMRREMVFFFNPCLKYLFYSRNPKGFAQYGFNSCRQTAIFGIGYMQEKFPDYTYKAFEGDFHDLMDGQYVDYTHAFIIATKKSSNRKNGLDRSVLIDLSRTTRPIKFQLIQDWQNIYDRGACYDDCNLKSTRPMDVDSMLHMTDVEFLTQMQPQTTMEVLKMMIENLHNAPPIEQTDFCKTVYSMFTKLKESEVSMQ